LPLPSFFTSLSWMFSGFETHSPHPLHDPNPKQI
jgi:hypothetical protein